MQHERLSDIKWLRFSRSSSQTARRHNAAEAPSCSATAQQRTQAAISRVNKSQSEMRRFLY